MAMGEADSDAEVMVGVLGRIRALVDGREVDLGGPRQQALLQAVEDARARHALVRHVRRRLKLREGGRPVVVLLRRRGRASEEEDDAGQ